MALKRSSSAIGDTGTATKIFRGSLFFIIYVSAPYFPLGSGAFHVPKA